MIKVKTIGQILPFKSGTALPSPSQAPGSKIFPTDGYWLREIQIFFPSFTPANKYDVTKTLSYLNTLFKVRTDLNLARDQWNTQDSLIRNMSLHSTSFIFSGTTFYLFSIL